MPNARRPPLRAAFVFERTKAGDFVLAPKARLLRAVPPKARLLTHPRRKNKARRGWGTQVNHTQSVPGDQLFFFLALPVDGRSGVVARRTDHID